MNSIMRTGISWPKIQKVETFQYLSRWHTLLDVLYRLPAERVVSGGHFIAWTTKTPYVGLYAVVSSIIIEICIIVF